MKKYIIYCLLFLSVDFLYAECTTYSCVAIQDGNGNPVENVVVEQTNNEFSSHYSYQTTGFAPPQSTTYTSSCSLNQFQDITRTYYVYASDPATNKDDIWMTENQATTTCHHSGSLDQIYDVDAGQNRPIRSSDCDTSQSMYFDGTTCQNADCPVGQIPATDYATSALCVVPGTTGTGNGGSNTDTNGTDTSSGGTGTNTGGSAGDSGTGGTSTGTGDTNSTTNITSNNGDLNVSVQVNIDNSEMITKLDALASGVDNLHLDNSQFSTQFDNKMDDLVSSNSLGFSHVSDQLSNLLSISTEDQVDLKQIEYNTHSAADSLDKILKNQEADLNQTADTSSIESFLNDWKSKSITYINDVDNSFNDLKTTISGDIFVPLPQYDSCSISFEIYGQIKSYDLCNYTQNLRPYFVFILTIWFTYLLIRINFSMLMRLFTHTGSD